MNDPVLLAIAGAGNRGTVYATWCAANPDLARVVAVADPDAAARDRIAELAGVPDEARYADWEEMLAAGAGGAEAIIIATQDHLHTEPCLAALKAGLHVLVEKPMATTAADCERIVAAARRSGRMIGVCHVMRYTNYTRTLKELLDGGAIGDLVSIQHLEGVGWWHQAHSYVRGNWAVEAESSPMLLAKSCHDYDWMSHIVGAPIESSASFGSLRHFRPENKPAEAADRCLDCPLQETCVYSATQIYLDPVREGKSGWPLDVVSYQPTVESMTQALREGPYGRCVYSAGNDVVDNQVVSLEFGNGVTGTFTMTAFTPMMDRQTRLFGTRGYLEGDGSTIRVYDFGTREWTVHEGLRPSGAHAGSGHGGGDAGLMADFVAALRSGGSEALATTAEDALQSHLAVFATERARHTRTVVGG